MIETKRLKIVFCVFFLNVLLLFLGEKNVTAAKPTSSFQLQQLCWSNFSLLLLLLSPRECVRGSHARPPQSCACASPSAVCVLMCWCASPPPAGQVASLTGTFSWTCPAAAQASTVCDLWPHRSSNWTHLWDLPRKTQTFTRGLKWSFIFYVFGDFF